jgi:hypothetical protein
VVVGEKFPGPDRRNFGKRGKSPGIPLEVKPQIFETLNGTSLRNFLTVFPPPKYIISQILKTTDVAFHLS